MPSLQTTYKHRYPLPHKEARSKPKNPMVNKAHQLIILPAVSINYLMHRLYSWARIMDKKSCQYERQITKEKKAEGRDNTGQKESSSSAASELGAVLGTWGSYSRIFKETEPVEDTDHLWIDMIER